MGRKPLARFPAIDASGFLRLEFPTGAEPLFASLFIDSAAGRVGFVFTEEARPGSFRVVTSGTRPALFVKGALKAAGLSSAAGPCEVRQEGGLFIVSRGESAPLPGAWTPFSCRASAEIPMVSIDSRGTLTLDRLCVRLISWAEDTGADAVYDHANGIFTLKFSGDSALAVRRKASHAELSFRGTLSSLGLPLPSRKVRYTAEGGSNTLRFCFKDPFPSTRA